MKEKIFKTICDVILEDMNTLYSKELTEDTDLVEDLGFDSVNLIEFIVLLEEKFGEVLGDEIMLDSKIKSLGEIVDIVYEKKCEGGEVCDESRF